MADILPDWLANNSTLIWWTGALSVATFVGSLILIPILVVRIPADYFMKDEEPGDGWAGDRQGLRIALLVVKNLLGAVLVLMGLAMLVIPGQGVLTILLGISLLNFPGKRSLELKILRQSTVLKTINWMRKRSHQPPLRLPEKAHASERAVAHK